MSLTLGRCGVSRTYSWLEGRSAREAGRGCLEGLWGVHAGEREWVCQTSETSVTASAWNRDRNQTDSSSLSLPCDSGNAEEMLLVFLVVGGELFALTGYLLEDINSKSNSDNYCTVQKHPSVGHSVQFMRLRKAIQGAGRGRLILRLGR